MYDVTMLAANVAVRAQQCALLAEPVAASRRLRALCQGHRAAHARDVLTGSDQGLHYVTPRLSSRRTQVGAL